MMLNEFADVGGAHAADGHVVGAVKGALQVLGGPLRSGFDAGIGWQTVVQMGGGQSGAKGGAAR